jgi:DNA-binding NarL/FixJ family response regulator
MWTKEENELLKAGTIPEGRSRKNAFTHAIMLGCADKLRQRTKPETRILTESELKLLRQNKVPEGITLQQARYLAITHGIPSYRPKQTELIERRNSRGRKIVQMRKHGMSNREIAERMGISMQYVYKLENLYNKTTK